ncbi:hypothetical protein ATCV1_z431R [Acanthocystis turfacea chlorella virus 1]|uniref:Uncharacterized protein z431R n=1 Tax=Chlorovirus heliozoae TaxID=322019 RepID=A7K941_9PHYC|nr:hypothetical protein ATCV1_z431R [Acanthocystis turfacea chlorella virus 1]ABT16565.1 hypothetical protein ATCV1_z431R [Acanthocystis turfacea chlorella virus 1]
MASALPGFSLVHKCKKSFHHRSHMVDLPRDQSKLSQTGRGLVQELGRVWELAWVSELGRVWGLARVWALVQVWELARVLMG